MLKGAKQTIIDAQKGQLKSAYLVTCLKQKVLDAYAEDFLFHLYCATNTACGMCAGCKKIQSQSAVDVYRIYPDNGNIKIGQIRALNKFLYEKAFEAETKTVIIFESDKMNIPAQNALLKPLEEPPKNTVFLLLASSDYSLLPTVVSRCENMRLLPMEKAHAQDLLIKEGLNKARVQLALSLSSGYYEQAANLANDEIFFALRNEFYINFNRYMNQKNYAVSYFVAFLDKNKEAKETILDMMKLSLMDMMKLKIIGKSASIVNIDKRDLLQGLATNFTTAVIYNMIERLLEFEARLKYNVNFILSCESMLFEILKEKYNG